ncbi:uncharacterized protein BDV14DRAFT_209941 [Aspergillus stella-maris]|uniref:uncharacterized protein n=1 Tax=Aspergillus stella-maris TaxID=1810926 RepID=UPI003CCDD06D
MSDENMPAAVDARLPRLPACHACYTKKVKCDNNRPRCAPCVRGGSECITLGLDGQQPVSRGYISDLEQRVRQLQTELQDAIDSPDERDEEVSRSRKRRRSSLRSSYSSPSFTEGAGLSFMRPLFTDPGWREHNPTLLQNLSNSARLVEPSISRNPLPSAEDARTIFDRYLNGTHVLNPFLLRREIEDVYSRVFISTTDEGTEHDLFRAFMLLAIGSIYPYRQKVHRWHPYGYFLSAMQHFKSDILSRGVSSIQDLLLIGRFGIYHHIGTSIWEITQLCMRLCIEHGLPKPPTTRKPLLQEQLERRVFWECYVIDRYSSITLDRPLAIADRDIQVLLPVDANDEEIEAAEGALSDLDLFQVASSVRSGHSELTVFFSSVRHRQITSNIYGLFQVKSLSGGPQTVTATGRICTNLYRLLRELDNWRQSTPVFENPKCLYETQDWWDLRWRRERLILVRKAMDMVPKRANTPPRDLLALCFENATAVITLFCRLYTSKQMTYTRSYFQTLFTAGLSIIFYLSVASDLDIAAMDQAMEALAQCEHVFKELGHELPDAIQYVAVYEALYRHISQKLRQSGRWDRGASDLQQGHAPLQPGHGPVAVQPQMLAGLGLSEGWPLPTPHSLPTGPDVEALLPEELLSFGALFWDDTVGNMEAGLGEYAYGNPHGTFGWDDGTFPL